eukprot:TRINITY_DN14964_c1_g1_i13.p1 TRINITY_DN14964_c1_g1~~TRINITY_DN14964_c1_g1_i13.p1  ORF type:complete len:1233 (+),score=275.17 TRINITY_DN14964_c1_g1_i13:297-3995(+)
MRVVEGEGATLDGELPEDARSAQSGHTPDNEDSMPLAQLASKLRRQRLQQAGDIPVQSPEAAPAASSSCVPGTSRGQMRRHSASSSTESEEELVRSSVGRAAHEPAPKKRGRNKCSSSSDEPSPSVLASASKQQRTMPPTVQSRGGRRRADSSSSSEAGHAHLWAAAAAAARARAARAESSSSGDDDTAAGKSSTQPSSLHVGTAAADVTLDYPGSGRRRKGQAADAAEIDAAAADSDSSSLWSTLNLLQPKKKKLRETAAAKKALKPTKPPSSESSDEEESDEEAFDVLKLPVLADAVEVFHQRVLHKTNAFHELEALPNSFKDTEQYYQLIAAHTAAEAREQIREALQELSTRRRRNSGLRMRVTSKKMEGPAAVVDVEPLVALGLNQLKRLAPGTVLGFADEAELLPAIVKDARRSSITLFMPARRTTGGQLLLMSGRAIGTELEVFATSEDITVSRRIYATCASRPQCDVMREVLPLSGAALAGCALPPRGPWQSIVAHPIYVYGSRDPSDRTGAQIPMQGVFRVDGVHEDDENERLYWLKLEGGGWVRNAKLTEGGELYTMAKPMSALQGRKAKAKADDKDQQEAALEDDRLLSPAHRASLQENLNASQRTAVQGILTGQQRLQLVQGPPGTGKSKTMCTLLQALIAVLKDGQLILVSAPTNKAVQNLASTMLALVAEAEESSPLKKVRMALAGSEERLQISEEKETVEPTLQDIFVNNAKGAFVVRLNAVKSLIMEKASPTEALEQLQQSVESFVRRAPKACKAAKFCKESLQDVKDANKVLFNRTAFVAVVERIRQRLQAIKAGPLEMELLSTCDVLFCTLASAGRESLQQQSGKRRAHFCIVDEAAQAVESETALLMAWNPRKLALVGDPQQLTASVISNWGTHHKYDRSMMGRLFELGRPYTMLQVQHRMHPEIARCPCRLFYRNRLRDSESVLRMASDMAVDPYQDRQMPPYLIVDVAEGREEAGALCNLAEADAVVRFAEALCGLTPAKSNICLLTFYKEQANTLQKRVEQLPGFDVRKVEVHTVDSFQGSEAPIVLLSCVRTLRMGFLQNPRRLNVAITRAQQRLVIFVNASSLMQARAAKATHLHTLVRDARDRQLIVPSNYVQQAWLRRIAPVTQIGERAKRNYNAMDALEAFRRASSLLRGPGQSPMHGREMRDAVGERMLRQTLLKALGVLDLKDKGTKKPATKAIRHIRRTLDERDPLSAQILRMLNDQIGSSRV